MQYEQLLDFNMILKEQWTPRTLEDKLIHSYSLENKGTYYLEVPIGSSKNGNWPPKSRIRRIDAVKFPLKTTNSSHIYPQKEFSYKKFKEEVSHKSVELIEAKKRLNRLVIGQVIAGYDMFMREYNPKKVDMVILCTGADPALEWVCQKRDIEVEIINP